MSALFDRQLTDRELEAFNRLRHNTDFETFLAWLRESLDDQDQSNRRLSAEALMRGQGTALTLERILCAVDEARDALYKRRRTPRRDGHIP